MRKIVIVLLTLIPLQVFAEHHRGHAIIRLEDAVEHLQISLDAADTIQTSLCAFDTWPDARQTKWTGTVKNYIQISIDKSENARALLQVPVVDLDFVRRELTHPNNDTPQSVIRRLKVVLINLGTIQQGMFTEDPDCVTYFRTVRMKVIKAWELIDQAVWHVHDAVREEIYGDPEFICSGPNNHCE